MPYVTNYKTLTEHTTLLVAVMGGANLEARLNPLGHLVFNPGSMIANRYTNWAPSPNPPLFDFVHFEYRVASAGHVFVAVSEMTGMRYNRVFSTESAAYDFLDMRSGGTVRRYTLVEELLSRTESNDGNEDGDT